MSRAEACADSFYGAFESAVDKLENRLRRVKDRRKVHYGDKTPCRWRRPRRSPAPDRAFNSEPVGPTTTTTKKWETA